MHDREGVETRLSDRRAISVAGTAHSESGHPSRRPRNGDAGLIEIEQRRPQRTHRTKTSAASSSALPAAQQAANLLAGALAALNTEGRRVIDDDRNGSLLASSQTAALAEPPDKIRSKIEPPKKTTIIGGMISGELIAARKIVTAIYGKPAISMSLTSARLPGGTEAAGVFRVVASYKDDRGRPRHRRLVIKHLKGRARREARILQDLGSGGRLLPDLLGIVHGGEGQIYLGLEDIRRASAWPWRDSTVTATLMQELGKFHEMNRHIGLGDDWNYEQELVTQAEQTRSRLAYCCRQPDFAALPPGLRAVERIAEELPRLRRLLLSERPFEAGLIHGDVHPGNALIRNGAEKRPVLIDWGRTRCGSPLEDVSSMLQSLRLYEPAALQRHDTLLKEYLTGRGRDRRITDSLRSVYWVAGASNALAGALGWHLMIAADEARPARQRRSAYCAARDWLRVIRRAHAWAL